VKLRDILLGLFLMQLGACFLFGSSDRSSHAMKAVKLREAGNFDQAIEEYRLHIATRAEDSSRPEDENPYFYEILIGDLYLEKKDPNRAIESYLIAKDKGVEIPLVSFRVRKVASYFREQGKLKEALDLLQKYRSMDDFQFDADIDELSKELVSIEDQGRR